MRFAIQLGSCLLWFPLSVLTITAVFRIGVRRYPLIFCYLVVSFLSAAVQTPIALAYHRSDRSLGDWFQLLNSIGQGATYTLILAVVFSFIYKATLQAGSGRVVRAALFLGWAAVLTVSFLAHYERHASLGVWMTPWTRDLNFCAALLDLVLWGLLLSSRKREPTLLLLTGGMGIMFAGDAIGAAIRSMAIPYRSYAIFYTGHILMVLADAGFLYVWWQTFHKEEVHMKTVGVHSVALSGSR